MHLPERRDAMSFGEASELFVLVLGGQAAVLGIAAWLGKQVVGVWIAKDLEGHKANLAAQNETARSTLSHTLALAATEHSARVQHLQARRAEVLAEVYKRLAAAVRAVDSYVSPMQWVGEPTKDEKGKVVNEALLLWLVYFDEHRIFIPQDLCDKLENFAKEVRSQAIFFSTFRPHDLGHRPQHAVEEAHKVWAKVADKMSTDVPAMRRALEDGFRSLIEVRPP